MRMLAGLVGLVGLVWALGGSAEVRADEACREKPGEPLFSGEDLFTPGEALSAVTCSAGLAGVYPCNSVDLMAFVPLSAMGCTGGNSLWGWTDAATDREYALMGCTDGIAFVDLTSPASPSVLGKLPTHTVVSSWRDVRVLQNRAYVISEAPGHGMQVFDLTRLRSVPSPPVTFTEDGHYGGFGSAHTIAIDEQTGFAYAAGSNTCSSGLHMVDVNGPGAPSFAGCVGQDGYTHETQCVVYHGPDAEHAGGEICFSANTDTLTIVDVTNKSAPQQLSRTTYAGVGYTHQGWLTEDHAHFLLDDETDETRYGHNTRTYVFDVSDLEAPVNTFNHTSALPAIDHNQYVRGNLLYQANYRAGLRILDLSGIAAGHIDEVASFDIYPPDDNPGFNGAWNTYPFFPSGNVLISGIEQGLFVVRPRLATEFTMSVPNPSLSICGTGIDTTSVALGSAGGYGGSVTLAAVGLPAGVTAGFSPNPVSVPGAGDLGVSTAGASLGAHLFRILASDGVLSRIADLTLTIADVPPPSPALTQPPDGALDEPIAPSFRWSAAPGASSYTLEIAADPAFAEIVHSGAVIGTTASASGLASGRLHYWRVRARNACGEGPPSPAFQLTTRVAHRILLVDDDKNDPDVRAYYTTVLDTLGAGYDVWEVLNAEESAGQERPGAALHAEEPDAGTLSSYRIVIWFSANAAGGTADPRAGPSAASEVALASFLDGGGRLLLSSQDYYLDRGLCPFMRDYMGVATAQNDVLYAGVMSAGSVFGGLGYSSFDFPDQFSNYTDRIIPDTTAEAAFTSPQGTAAVDKATAVYRTIFLGFPFEALPTEAKRASVMARALGFLAAPCPTIVVQPSALPDGVPDSGYAQAFVAYGGAAPATFSVEAGSLPPGILLARNGLLSGTPSSSGSFTFVIAATDATGGCSGTRAYTVNVDRSLGEPTDLTVTKTATDLVLQWSPPVDGCGEAAYAVYTGDFAALRTAGYTHDTILTCAAGGAAVQIPLSDPAAGSAAYFLVVAQGEISEGSYGRDWYGSERPPSTGPCMWVHNLHRCP